MRIGDASRSRRFASPARRRWYAFHRSVRFALRMMGPQLAAPLTEDFQAGPIGLESRSVEQSLCLGNIENPLVPLY